MAFMVLHFDADEAVDISEACRETALTTEA